jgi:hypothetical protein
LSANWKNLVKITVERTNGIVIHSIDFNEANWNKAMKVIAQGVTVICGPPVALVTSSIVLLKLIGI